MRKTLRSSDYRFFLDLLRKARQDAGLTQQELAGKLRKPQSFVAKYETGERRIDVVEFVELARALGADPAALFDDFVGRSPLPDAKTQTGGAPRRPVAKSGA